MALGPRCANTSKFFDRNTRHIALALEWSGQLNNLGGTRVFR